MNLNLVYSARVGMLMSAVKIRTDKLNLYYGKRQVLRSISLEIRSGTVTALIGPSGCGKSTFLRTLNRMNDLIDDIKIEGGVYLDGDNIYAAGVEVEQLRRRVGMVFQQPNPFPMSVYDNVAYGPRIHGIRDRKRLDGIVEHSLRKAAVWEETKGCLERSALWLSGGQQQRVCIARALAVEPEVLLMDEPTSALDPVSTVQVEQLMRDFKRQYTVVLVTHNMQQAARVSDETVFFLDGEAVECAPTYRMFSRPHDRRTRDYIDGRFG